ncbi:hypothetical protein I204_07483 [Kwoniella mangroviensis CBS 8886]|uniref:hypothetical protein n=1 Tax=Kwoniella mangroviensis CBS 8507 TaxID=1296122 RepID=UPI00080D132F|nr:uncharacterized protein I203_08522 [Kwoniella mangroviensis CBS 8507]OCF62396.1 hypothetical protein I203_08522 [Kwoniella mangroviensis CBS 8507]OCF72218.1 hypothetical protein I204_07483 [Kwoniella mangroviensis CBS 8886]
MIILTALLPLMALTSVLASAIVQRSGATDVKLRVKDTDDCLSKKPSPGDPNSFGASTEKCADAPKWTINRDQPGKIQLAGSKDKVLESSQGGVLVTLEAPEDGNKFQEWTFRDDGSIKNTFDGSSDQEYCLAKTTDPIFTMDLDDCPEADAKLDEGDPRVWEIIE